ncbi:MAG TPA: hypothetical protein VNO21_08375 [Polyangiaceae bacterium]|nr:hypothetical protein [Polyangiaceae bacterium]
MDAAERKAQANALRELADVLENGNALPREVERSVKRIAALMRLRRSVREWREAKDEQTIPSAEARKILGL